MEMVFSGLQLDFHKDFFQRDIKTAHKKFLKFYTDFTNDLSDLFSGLSGCHIINANSVEN